MAISNHERVGKGLELLSQGLKSFVERELRTRLGTKWEEPAKGLSPDGKPNWSDPHLVLSVMWDQWNTVFKEILGHAERSLVSELRDMRNKWAHRQAFSGNDAHRALDSMARLLSAVSAPEAGEVEQMRIDLMRVQFDEQRRHEMRKASAQPTEGKPQGGLKPWREIVTPHPDVASGRYQQAEFAADLWQVYLKEGSDEYKNPTEFFRRTFLTEGLKQLLQGSLLRLAGKGGDPVVELQTNFGGGKTHSILALFHLFSGARASELPGVEELLKESSIEIPKNVRRAVIVGTKISPGQIHNKPDGTRVRTLWGEIAWQLGGKEGYALVKEDDERGTNPGDRLKELFNKYAPCLILIDEWVAYARQLHDDLGLPAGTYDAQFTFAQALTEAAKAAKSTLVVVSIPSSDNEIGGERGKKALAQLKNAVGRVEASWRPASTDEGFEIVRRRLFQPIGNQEAVARDAIARSFVEMYGSQHQEFPAECREGAYERRIKMAYPIHPELFDRLFNDWSTLERFQRTRGVLRLMAAVIHSLWERQDNNLLIMPGTIPIDEPQVQHELTQYVEDNWVPVIEKDVDGPHSMPLELDRNNPNLGRYSACRRVARAIYLGSAPTLRAANKGLEDRQIKLGCVQPGETVATFGDALRRLTDRATYLYVDGKRYWYSTQPTVSRLAEDRAGQLHEHDVIDEIVSRLKKEAAHRGDFSRIHPCIPSSDVVDETEARLVIIGPETPHKGRNGDSPARKEAASILETRGTSPRNYKNTLVFLAADEARLNELKQAVRQYKAWSSIWRERETLNLDPFQAKQAETKSGNADETVNARIPEAYQWLLVPTQSDPNGQVEWQEIRLQGQDHLSVRASKKLRNEELLLTQFSGIRLRMELDRVPLWRGDHVSTKDLAEYFAQYTYLPRLATSGILVKAVEEGVGLMTWQAETFAYADGWDEVNRRYLGLRAGQNVTVSLGKNCLVVKPDVAQKQILSDTETPSQHPPGSGVPGTTAVTGSEASSSPAGDGEVPVTPALPTRFHGSVELDATRIGRDASQIATEVVQHVAGLLGADVQVTLEIQAIIPGGAPDNTVRTVTENCRTLKFKSFGFERE